MSFIKKLSTLTSCRSSAIKSFCTASQISSQELPRSDKLYSRLEIELKGVEPEVMKSYGWYATTAAEHLGIQVGKCFTPRKADKDRWTVLKSVHVHRKHLVQYEARTYYRFLNFHNLTESTLKTFLEYIQRNLPEGTAMKATKVEIQRIPEHIEKSMEENSQKK